MERNQLDTIIEKEAHRLMDTITERAYDFVHVFVMRNRMELDRPTMDQVLNLVKTANQDIFMTHIDTFKKNVGKALDEYTDSENPLQPTSSQAATSGVKTSRSKKALEST